MSYQNPTLDELAWHEAGHAYAYAALTDEVPEELGIRRVGRDANRGWCRRGTILFRTADRLSDVPLAVRKHFAWQAAAEVIVALAGPIAEGRFRSLNDQDVALEFFKRNAQVILTSDAMDDDVDLARVRSSFEFVQPALPNAALIDLIDLAGEIVDANWTMIGLLAERLRKKRRLSTIQLDFWFTRNEPNLFSFEPEMFFCASTERDRAAA